MSSHVTGKQSNSVRNYLLEISTGQDLTRHCT